MFIASQYFGRLLTIFLFPHPANPFLFFLSFPSLSPWGTLAPIAKLSIGLHFTPTLGPNVSHQGTKCIPIPFSNLRVQLIFCHLLPQKTLFQTVMSWGWTEGVPRFYIFGEDSASAYVLHYQTSTVLKFWARGRRGLGGSDGEFEGQSMSISD